MVKFDSCPPKYNSAVLAKIDSYSCDFYECSMADVVCGYLKLPINVQDEFFRDVFSSSRTSEKFVGWRYNNIFVSARASDMRAEVRELTELDEVQSKVVFNTQYAVVRLNVSGQGLTYLRSVGFDPEVEFRKLPELRDNSFSPGGDPLPKWHVTRVDIAFDFINYMGTFYDDCYDYLLPIFQTCLSEGRSPRVVCGSINRNYSFDLKTTTRTITVGTRGHHNMCRIYDKLYERKCKKADLDPAETGGISNISSWIRFEIEYGRDKASEVLYGHGDYLSILKFAQSTFKFFIPKTSTPAPFWDELYNWGEIAEFIQNVNWYEPVETKESVISKAANNLDVVAYIAVYGWDAFRHLMQSAIDEMMVGTDRRSEYRRKKFLTKVTLLQDDYLDSSQWHGASIKLLSQSDACDLKLNYWPLSGVFA